MQQKRCKRADDWELRLSSFMLCDRSVMIDVKWFFFGWRSPKHVQTPGLQGEATGG